MRYLVLSILLLTFIFSSKNQYGQCNNGANFYPATAYTPPTGVWASATIINWAGEVIQVNVISGDTYEFSTCNIYGGVAASYDTELTLRDNVGNLLSYNDDFAGCGTNSYISWTSTITGVVHLHINEFPCASNSTATEVMIYRSIGGGGGGVGSNYCTLPNAPSDFPCSAPSIDLSQAYYGSTNCNYTVDAGGTDPGPDNFCGASNNDSWLQFTAADDTIVLDWTVENCSNGNGVQFAVFDGNCWDQDNMVEIACENPALGSGTFTIPDGTFGTYPLTIGQDYFVYIDGWAGDLCDYFWEAQSGIAINPPNDSCDNAIVLNCGDLDTSNNILATSNDAPSSCGGLTTGAGVWYKYIGDGSDVTLSTSNSTTNFDTEIFVYSGACTNLTCVGSDNNSGSGTTSSITFTTTTGVEYFIYVDGNGSSNGQFVLSVSCINACNANAGSWN